MTRTETKRRRAHKWWLGSIVVFLSLGLCALFAEILFRLVPGTLPAGYYRSGMRYDPDLELFVSDGPVIYNKVRLTVRRPNADGFMDVTHAPAKPPGTYRLGVLGDSFVEAIQVPLHQTFFRQLEKSPPSGEVEILAFGQGGWGTLEAIRTHAKYGELYDLDAIVYLFVENDPGNNHYVIENGRSGVYRSSRCAAKLSIE